MKYDTIVDCAVENHVEGDRIMLDHAADIYLTHEEAVEAARSLYLEEEEGGTYLMTAESEEIPMEMENPLALVYACTYWVPNPIDEEEEEEEEEVCCCCHCGGHHVEAVSGYMMRADEATLLHDCCELLRDMSKVREEVEKSLPENMPLPNNLVSLWHSIASAREALNAICTHPLISVVKS